MQTMTPRTKSGSADIRRIALSCGATLLVERMPNVRSAGLTWLIPVGSASDDPRQEGASTILSEWIWRGAAGLDSRQHSDALDRLGVQRGSATESQHLRLGATMVGSRLNDALPLIVDAVLRPALADDTFDPVVDWALQGLSGLKDDPQQRSTILLREHHFPEPLNRSGMGREDSLRRLTPSQTRDLWHDRARPGGSIIGLAGDIDADDAAGRLNALLAEWRGSAEIIPARDDGIVKRYHHEKDATTQVHIGVAYAAPPEPHPDSMLERVATSVLSGGMSGRLFTEVREKRSLCYSVHASYAAGRTLGAVLGYSGTTHQRAAETLEVLLQEFRKMSRGVTADEFQRAIVGMKSRLVMQGESSSARASAIAHDYYVMGRPRTLDELIGEVAAITLDRVNEYLSRRTPLEKLTIVTVGPEPLKTPALL